MSDQTYPRAQAELWRGSCLSKEIVRSMSVLDTPNMAVLAISRPVGCGTSIVEPWGRVR